MCSSATHYRRREREKKIFIKTDESDNFLDFLQLLFISYIINSSSKRERERYRERNREERARQKCKELKPLFTDHHRGIWRGHPVLQSNQDNFQEIKILAEQMLFMLGHYDERYSFDYSNKDSL